MKYSRQIVSLALATALGMGAVHAQNTAPQPAPAPQPQASPSSMTPPAAGAADSGAPAFDSVSKNGKSVSRSDIPKDVDALKPLRAHFNEADLNHDGKVDKAEYDAYVNKSSQPQPQH